MTTDNSNISGIVESAVNALDLDIEWNDSVSGTIDLYGVPLAFSFESGSLCFKSSLGTPPDEMLENAKFWRLLMEQNNFYCKLAGASLGYDAENGIITFQWVWPLVDINAARLENMLLNYGKGLEYMQTLVQQGVHERHNELQSFEEASLLRG